MSNSDDTQMVEKAVSLSSIGVSARDIPLDDYLYPPVEPIFDEIDMPAIDENAQADSQADTASQTRTLETADSSEFTLAVSQSANLSRLLSRVVRKRPRSVRQSKPRKTRTPKALPKRIVYTREMTDKMMEWFGDCKRTGYFNSTKVKNYSPAWEEVYKRCKEQWPDRPWTVAAIKHKYDTEKARYRIWKKLVTTSGVGYDWDLNLPTRLGSSAIVKGQ
ncbi:hypothetical protein QBC32DRAFT_365483 [Pseudoneurospora amorphoporcata]|uniref:Myb/SANT-like domain-containing protein n=1 Tax=Pseudoneurospora amorphoporcata TaxID=241081 RepID=A0AAN6SCF5_9PEZI|nr:hypothetical protein QBC32DRAFT_365483 [Pseudoneurospora amorphoporcata]